MERTLTAVYRRSGGWWAARVEEVPGALTQGRTLEEALTNLQEALFLVLDDNAEISGFIEEVVVEPIKLAS